MADVAQASVEVPSERIITESNFPNGSKETVVGSVGFKSATRISPSGELADELSGQPVRGESDVLHVCESLQEALRQVGVVIVGKFRTPAGREDGIDAEGETTAGSAVRVQVVGVVDQATLAQLGRKRRASSEKNADQLASEICNAVKKKIDAYPATQRTEVTLALDAIRSPGHVATEVIEALKSSPYIRMLRASGFQAIWLVGPTAALTYQLARQPP